MAGFREQAKALRAAAVKDASAVDALHDLYRTHPDWAIKAMAKDPVAHAEMRVRETLQNASDVAAMEADKTYWPRTPHEATVKVTDAEAG